MAWPEYAVPLTLHDLPTRETYINITASLKALEEASNGVFARIEEAVGSRRGMCTSSLLLENTSAMPQQCT